MVSTEATSAYLDTIHTSVLGILRGSIPPSAVTPVKKSSISLVVCDSIMFLHAGRAALCWKPARLSGRPDQVADQALRVRDEDRLTGTAGLIAVKRSGRPPQV